MSGNQIKFNRLRILLPVIWGILIGASSNSVMAEKEENLSLPAIREVTRVVIEPGIIRWFEPRQLLKLLPRFVPAEGTYLTKLPFQRGSIVLKNGRKIRWMAGGKNSLLLFDDHGTRREQLFVLQDERKTSNEPPLFLMWDEKGKYGFMDAAGRVRIAPQFDGALPFSEGFAAVALGKLWGFIDSSGKIIVPLKYRAVSPFSDALAAVTIKTDAAPYPCGYIDHSGKFIIEPQNKYSCTSFQEGYAMVAVYDQATGEDLNGFIDKTGQLVIGGNYANAEPFSEGYALVNDFYKDYFIAKKGAEINLQTYGGTETLSDVYEPTGSFSEGLALVGIKTFSRHGYSRYGFVNKRGKVVFKLPERVRVEGDFQNGRALVLEEKTQKVKVKIDREIITMAVEISAYGFIDRSGKMTILPKYSAAESFYENLAAVKTGSPKPSNERDLAGSAAESAFKEKDGTWVCINPAGAIVIKNCGQPLSYDELNLKFSQFGKGFGSGFVNGLFFSKTQITAGDGKPQAVFGYLNKNGKYVWIAPHGKNSIPPKSWREMLNE